MKRKFSNITFGFCIAGFLFGLLTVVLSQIYAHTGEATRTSITNFFYSYLLILCPPSLGVMVLDNPDDGLFTYIIVYVQIVLLNTALYGLVGMGISKLWNSFRKPVSSV